MERYTSLGDVSRVGAGEELGRVGALVAARGWVTLSGGTAMSRPGKGLRRATTRAHPSTSHPPSPLRDIPAVPRLMPIRADKSAMGAINRPLHCLDARLPITILYT